jgi:hypothetical protein
MDYVKYNAVFLLLKSDAGAMSKCKNSGSYSCSYPRCLGTRMATAELQIIGDLRLPQR